MIDYRRPKYGIHHGAVLVLSHQIYDEVAAVIYNRRSFKFFAISYYPYWNYPALRVIVCFHESHTWDIFPSFLTFVSSSPFCSKSAMRCTGALVNLPYERLKSIEIEFGAPNPADAGELIGTWVRVVWIVNLLQHADKLPNIEIRATETPGRCWHIGDKLNKSIEGPDSYDIPTDLELLLMPFRNLRNVQQVKVQVPITVPKHGGLDKVIKTIEIKTGSTLPFGTQLDHDDGANDMILASEEDTWSVWLDYVLDDLPGPAAAMCRRERFSHWCDEYEADSLARIHDIGSLGGTFMENDRRRQMEDGFVERRRAVCAFNPMAHDDFEHSWNVDRQREYHEPLTYARPWSWDWSSYVWREWYAENGIPRKSSPEYQNRMQDWSYQMEQRGIRPLDYYYQRPLYHPNERYRKLLGRKRIRKGKWLKVDVYSKTKVMDCDDWLLDSDNDGVGANSDSSEDEDLRQDKVLRCWRGFKLEQYNTPTDGAGNCGIV